MAVFIGDYFARGLETVGRVVFGHAQPEEAGRRRAADRGQRLQLRQGGPALLSYDDARTLFHEFGHALHQMLSDVTYGSISGHLGGAGFRGTAEPALRALAGGAGGSAETRFATPCRDRGADPAGPPGPSSGGADLRHGVPDGGIRGLGAGRSRFPRRGRAGRPDGGAGGTLERIGMPRAIGMRHATPHFAHVFAGDGYSSGYYSYMWSEVMDADAFAAFEEAGDVFDAGLAGKLEEHILSAGGSQDAAELYTAFRGRMPGVEALLKGRGLDKVA
jgi:peptidyl-dipeptidase Dcp